MIEEDQDSLFGSPPPSPRILLPRPQSPALSLPSASTYDSERRLSTSTDTQNVGTIALPGSHPYSELPLNPLALSLNHSTTVHRPPAQHQAQQVPKSPLRIPASRDPEFALPDPSAPPPAHFLRNQQNLLGKAGLVAGVKPATITHIRGATPSNPITVEDEDTPTLGRQSQFRDSSYRHINPALLSAPTNEDIVSVLIGQKDIFPVLEGILSIIGKGTTRPTPTPPLQTQDHSLKRPPMKRRKLNRVPAGATDWDVPYPFQEGEGPDEYHKTWERERGKRLVAQLVKLIKAAARKAATKNYLRAEQARQAAWEKLQQEMMMESEPVIENDMTVNNQNQFDTWMTFLQAFPVPFDAQPQLQNQLQPQPQPQYNLPSSQDSTPDFDDFAFINAMGNDIDFGNDVWESPNKAAVPDGLEALISSMLNPLPQEMESTPSVSVQSQGEFEALMGVQSTDIVLPPYPSSSSTTATTPVPVPPPPRPKNTISQSQKEEILKRAREKRRQVQEELDGVKTQLWETTIEQAALVHLLKRYESNN